MGVSVYANLLEVGMPPFRKGVTEGRLRGETTLSAGSRKMLDIDIKNIAR